MKKMNSGSVPFLLFFLIVILSSYGLLFLPVPRQIGLIFRNTLYVFPLLLLLVYVSCVIRNRWVRPVAYGILFMVFLMPLSGVWNSGISWQYGLGGAVPWSDGFTLQMNTLRFLYGQTMGQSSALRPISPVFYASILRLTDNNFRFLFALLLVLAALCVLLCTDLIGKKAGPAAAAFFYANAFFYFREHQGEYMTEVYGFLAGMLSCYFLLSGIFDRKNGRVSAGFFLTSLALNGRPGPMFILMTAGLWYFFVFLRQSSRKFLLGAAALAAMLSGFAINSWNTYQTYGAAKVPNRQLAEIVYGLCLGGHTWDYTLQLPEIQALNDSDQVYLDLFRMCRSAVAENPANLAIAASRITDTLIHDDEKGAFSYFNGGDALQVDIVRYGLQALWCLGIVICVVRYQKKEYAFLLACVLGMVISQALGLVLTTNRLRFHAATIWLPGILIGLFPQYLLDKIPGLSRKREQAAPHADSLPLLGGAVLSSILALSSVFSPLLLKAFPLKTPAANNPCGEEASLLFTKIDEGSYFYMQDNEKLPVVHYPYFRLPYVRQHFHDTASVEMFDFTDRIEQPTAVIRGIDFENWQDALVFAPLELVEGKTGFVRFCGTFVDPPVLRNDRFFIAEQAHFIE